MYMYKKRLTSSVEMSQNMCVLCFIYQYKCKIHLQVQHPNSLKYCHSWQWTLLSRLIGSRHLLPRMASDCDATPTHKGVQQCICLYTSLQFWSCEAVCPWCQVVTNVNNHSPTLVLAYNYLTIITLVLA